MHVSSALLLTLLAGAGVAKSMPADDSDLGFYFDDAPPEPILSKRQRGAGGFRGAPPMQTGGAPSGGTPFSTGYMHQNADYPPGGSQTQAATPAATGQGSQTQAAAPTVTNQGSQGGSRSVSSIPTAPAATAAVSVSGKSAGSMTTVHTTLMTGTVTKTLVANQSANTQTTMLHRRQMGMPWWQHRGFQWGPHANADFSASGASRWNHGEKSQPDQDAGQSTSQSASQGQAPPQTQTQSSQADMPQSSQAPAASASPSSAPASSSDSGSGSGYMATVSKWRSAMGSGALTQDSTLEGNALKTVKDGNGQMNHELNPGSFAQVLGPGNAGNFESVFVGGWLCEVPSLPGLNGICSSMSAGWDHSDGETGHADILHSKDYKKIGCALANGIWGCDLAY